MPSEPPADCPLCPRLAEWRQELRQQHPQWHNAPVPAFGDPNARMAIVGLAPGLQGANRTGRPFTGDYAGHLLYETLIAQGLAHGDYQARPDDGLVLDDCIIINSVRCVPPQNKPLPAEIQACRGFLIAGLSTLPNVKVLFALGQIAHQSAVKAYGGKLPKYPFAHGAVHRLHQGPVLVDSYHCSRYNQNTGRLTAQMFAEAVATAAALRLEN